MNKLDTTQEVDIPSIPPELILTIEQAQMLDPVILYKEDGSVYQVDWYRVYTCDQALTDWVIENFPVEVDLVEYVVSDRAIVMHTDLGRDQAYNYLLDAGGTNIITEFYNSDQTQMIDNIEYQTNKWYVLNVGLPHKVSGPQTAPRFLISVTPKSGVTYKF